MPTPINLIHKYNKGVVADKYGRRCWICDYPVLFTNSPSAPLRASRDHVGDDLRLAHAWCNSRRGSRDAALTDEIRKACRDYMQTKYPRYLRSVGEAVETQDRCSDDCTVIAPKIHPEGGKVDEPLLRRQRISESSPAGAEQNKPDSGGDSGGNAAEYLHFEGI